MCHRIKMGVPDDMEGPPRKKPKLSLGIKRKDQGQQLVGAPAVGSDLKTYPPVLKQEHDSTSDAAFFETTARETRDLTVESPPAPDAFVPPVASLHNLGNTCFMNSMLQVLRYTPAFLQGVVSLSREIEMVEKKLEKSEDSDGDQPLSLDMKRTWTVVKNIHLMYLEMEQTERKNSRTPTSEALHMAVRPAAVLDSIRELNPMFEGNFQHDAQELLRCLLCYMEDAERDVRKMKSRACTKEDNAVEKTECSNTASATGGNVSRKQQREIKLLGKINEGKSAEMGDGEAGVDCSSSLRTREKPKKQFRLKGGASSSKLSNREVAGEKEKNGVRENDCLYEKCSPPVHVSEVTEGEIVHCGSAGGADCGRGSTAKRSRGKKRKRDLSKSTKEQDEGDRLDQNNWASSLEAVETNSDAVVLPVKKGAAAAKKKSSGHGNGQTIVGFFKRIKEKLIPSTVPAPNADDSASSKSEAANLKDTSSNQGVISTLPLKGKRRLGMNGYVCRQPPASAPTEEDVKHLGGSCVKSEESPENEAGHDSSLISDCFIIEEQRKERRGSPLKTSNSSPQVSNRCGSPLTKTLHTPSPSKTTFLLGAGSPHSVEASDEISLASESDVAMDIESTIDSVTKKYYSTLSRPNLHHVVSTTQEPLSRAADVGSSSDTTKGAQQKKQTSPSCSNMSPLSPHHLLTPGKDLIIHSPSKMETFSARKSSVAKAINFDVVANQPVPDSLTMSVPKSDRSQPKSASDLLDFLPKSVRQVSESQSLSELRNNLLQLDNDGVTTRSNKSAPNSPLVKYDRLTSLEPMTPVAVKTSPKSAQKFASVTKNLQHKSKAELKIEVKRCDWLGVSPVKSVSASLALRKHLQWQQRQVLSPGAGDASRVKHKILCDFSQPNSSSSSKSDLPQGSDNLRDSLCDNMYKDKSGLKEILETDPVLQTRRNRRSIRAIKSHIGPAGDFFHKRREQSEGEKNTPKTLRNPRVEKDNELSDSAKTPQIYCPQGLQLKPVTVSVDKCDWMLSSSSAPPSSSSSSRKSPPILCQQMMVDGRVRIKRIKRKVQNGSKTENDSSGSTLSQRSKQPAASEYEGTKSAQPLVERLFGGTMVHLTRCLECERSRERREAFLDISVAVKHLKEAESDDSFGEEEEGEDTTSSSSCLASLVQSSSQVERLRDSNKYWCERCLHHVEAERSCHYQDVPQILSLHLKRFSAGSGFLGGVSKLNDKVNIPERLPCFRHGCGNSCCDPKHSYQLFALATHSGTSILHGHYRAYVKVQPWVSPGVFHNLLDSQGKGCNGSTPSAAGHSWSASGVVSATGSSCASHSPQRQQADPACDANLLVCAESDKCDHQEDDCDIKIISSPSSPHSRGVNEAVCSASSGREGKRMSSRTIGDFYTCDRVVSSKNRLTSGGGDQDADGITSSLMSRNLYSSSQTTHLDKKTDFPVLTTEEVSDTGDGVKVRPNAKNNFNKQQAISLIECKQQSDGDLKSTETEPVADRESPACFWLECDDECVRVMEEEEFGHKLREEDGTLLGTPYVLFYHSQTMVPT